MRSICGRHMDFQIEIYLMVATPRAGTHTE